MRAWPRIEYVVAFRRIQLQPQFSTVNRSEEIP